MSDLHAAEAAGRVLSGQSVFRAVPAGSVADGGEDTLARVPGEI